MTKYDERFVNRLLELQPRLRAFIRSLIPFKQESDDVIQETNLVLCRKAAEFAEGSNFSAWAMQVAYFQVLAHRQSVARSRLVFRDDVLCELAAVASGRIQEIGERGDALRLCLERLPAAQRQMMTRRYNQGMTVAEIAKEVARPVGSVRQALYRIRTALQECIDRRLAGERGYP